MEVIIAGHIPDERVQSLTDHLDGTMRLAEGFGAGMGRGQKLAFGGKYMTKGKIPLRSKTISMAESTDAWIIRRLVRSLFLKMRYRLAATDRWLLCGRTSYRDPRLGKQSRYCRNIYATRAYEKRYPFRPTSGTLLYG